MDSSTLLKNYKAVSDGIPASVILVAVSKFQPVEALQNIYNAGQRIFGGNRVQEMVEKKPLLPADIQWHCIGTLQTNKVKYIAPFVALIHSVDSLKLLTEINKQAQKNNRVIDCLLEIFIAQEETKHGLSFAEAEEILAQQATLPHIRITGFMGMASNTTNLEQVRAEFKTLSAFYFRLYKLYKLSTLSMGMSSDYKIAIEEGSTMVRVGSSIFGSIK